MWSDLIKLKVLVLGMARSGLTAANLLKAAGCTVTISDCKGYAALEPYLSQLSEGIEIVIGEHPMSLLDQKDLIVLSPGIPLNIPLLIEAQRQGIPIVSEVEAAYEVLQRFKATMPFVDLLFLAVTGTNGKSTTTTLLHEFLINSGYNSILAGNIGSALSGEAHRFIETENIYDYPNVYFFVLELSSFQLETIKDFKPYGSTILNITPDHLDRYKSMTDYAHAKFRIFKNQTSEGFIVLNGDDPHLFKGAHRINTIPEELRPSLFYFSRTKQTHGAFYAQNKIHFNITADAIKGLLIKIDPEVRNLTLYPERFKLKGVHNIENVMAASLMAALAGCGKDALEHTLETFAGLEHRLEFVRELNGVVYINDSKGTNIGAVAKSLEGYETPVILIAGGRDKSSDFSLLRQSVKEKVKSLILIGEAADKISKALEGCCDIHFAKDLSSAVIKAKEQATEGDTVLLSPACASFDMFRDFEDRGRQFKEIVRGL